MTNRDVSISGPAAQASNDNFENAYRRGFWKNVVSWFLQEDNSLLQFDEVRKKLPFSGQHDIGYQQVPLDQIVGSVGRYNDFDRWFLPRQTKTKYRWVSVDQAHLKDIILPPIEVYKIGSLYFVKDGNHRVSVAREHGQVDIDAYVIEITVPYPVTSETDLDELIRNHEYIQFMKDTHLNEFVPDGDFRLTLAGGYQKLLEHIRCHQWFMGEHRKNEVSWDDAVKDWYDEIYLPLVKVIRENKILEEFNERTETDLYLWIIEHLWYLREEYKEEISLEEAVHHFSSEFSPRPFRTFENIIKRVASLVRDSLEDVFLDDSSCSEDVKGETQEAAQQKQ